MTNYEIVFNGYQIGGEMLTVLHYQGDTLTDAQKQELADLVKNDMESNLQAQLVSSAGYTGITIREDIPGSVGVNYPFTGGAVVGTGAGEDVFPQGCALVRKYCDSTSRPNQGRLFQGGLSVGALEANGQWASTVTAALTTFWADEITHSLVSGPVLNMVVKASKPTNPNTVAYNPVARVVTAGKPATQRRRKDGVGS